MADYTLPELPYDYGALAPHTPGRSWSCLAFNRGGHVNHSVFWTNMSPDGGDKPDGEFAAAIDEHFGSFDAFRRQAMNRTIGEAASAQDPLRGLAEMIFGLSSLSGILLDELAQATGRSHGEVLHAVHLRYLDPTG